MKGQRTKYKGTAKEHAKEPEQGNAKENRKIGKVFNCQ
jgi:hypothetical protein